MIKKKLKFSFILCAIIFAFFCFNFANAQVINNNYFENQQFGNETFGRIQTPIGFNSFAIKFKAPGNSVLQAGVYCLRQGGTTCSFSSCIATEATSTACISGNANQSCSSSANWSNQRFFGLGVQSYYFSNPATTTKDNYYYLVLTGTNSCGSSFEGVEASSTWQTESYLNGVLSNKDTSLYLVGSSTPAEECATCPECETCTGSSTLVHFDFANATTTDISRIVATSKTYTDDTGTPTSIMVSTFDIPINLFYYICMIMIMLVITIFLYFKIKKHGKD